MIRFIEYTAPFPKILYLFSSIAELSANFKHDVQSFPGPAPPISHDFGIILTEVDICEKHILIVQGGWPKSNTARLAAAFTQGAESTGHTAETISFLKNEECYRQAAAGTPTAHPGSAKPGIWNGPSIDFCLSLDATPMDEWTVYRLTGDTLRRIAEG